jgi:hypothetical protein
MAIAYRTHGPGGVSVDVWVDKITPKQAAQHVAELAAQPAWGARRRILTDLCYVSSESIPTYEEIRELARRFEEQIGARAHSAKWAVVANQAFVKAAEFGDEVRNNVGSLIVFFDLASACLWLGADEHAMRDAIGELRQEARRPRRSRDA